MSSEIKEVDKGLTIVVFCYRGEEEILPMTLGRAHAAFPEARIHLFDDSLDPLRPTTVSSLQEAVGCTYTKTAFDRQVNLNGKECVIGELEHMLSAMEEDGNNDGYIIKMDPDTIILRPEYVRDALYRGAEFITHNSVKGLFAGMFYVASHRVLENALVTARESSLPVNCAEDCTIGSLCYLTAHRLPHVWVDVSTTHNARYFAAVPTANLDGPRYWNDIVFCSVAGCILTVGNTALDGWTKGYQTKIAADLLWAFYNPDDALQRVSPDFVDKLKVAPLPPLLIKNEGLTGLKPVSREGSGSLRNPILTGAVTTPKPHVSVQPSSSEVTLTNTAGNSDDVTILPPEVPEEDALQIIE